jgi:hypothetical protein
MMFTRFKPLTDGNHRTVDLRRYLDSVRQEPLRGDVAIDGSHRFVLRTNVSSPVQID